ncbi:PEP-CTERM sorting domain-containing protein [Phragmitibacter flavus]|uniref:PEP-CTERM sorting domain-containing protein n=1 Tax=Phragmitibacter flavus TaxID=2576071 RepID=A0A5R8KK63_9BACT|nr:PEP-CTERM sorting domain-containing protein [Phragmitibacter flavus]TLD72640.1 PEP-CTERM sorting domain-containing protein [Phragmitibacter flavus]
MSLLRLIILATLAAPLSSGRAATIISTGSGHWNTNASTIWTGGAGTTGPRVGNAASSADSVEILAGHIISFSAGSPGTGSIGTNDFALGNGNVVSINGGVFAHANNGGNWFRLGQFSGGTFNINDGAAYLPVGNVQVGLGPAGSSTVRIGDGTGAAGSAILNMRDAFNVTNGTTSASGHISELNLGSQQDNTLTGSAGFIIIESDGILEGAQHTTTNTATAGNPPNWVYSQSTTRIGRYGSETESSLIIKAGGRFNARGNIEVGANRTAAGLSAKGLLHLDGTGANLTHSFGDLTIGYTGDGRMIIENGAEYIRLTHAVDPISGVIPRRNTLHIGRNAAGVGTLDIRSGGKFIRDSGGNVGDLYIGTSGRGTVTISDGGEFINRSTNWDWVGVDPGGQGAIIVNEGGIYTSSANLVLGRDAASGSLAAANGRLEINNGQMTIGDIHIGQDGRGHFLMNGGTASVNRLTMARGTGTSTLDIRDGELTIRGNFFAGGDSDAAYANSTAPGIATITQSGGTVTATNAMSIGLSAGHTATFDMTGGEFYHEIGDITIGEKGTGTTRIGKDATFIDQSNQVDSFLFVGRQDGSNGILMVDGYLEKTNAAAGIRVGYGSDAAGLENNTTGVGLIGGTGEIKAPGSIWVGNRGTITGGTKTTAGLLTIDGGLNLVSTVGSATQSTLFVNFDSNFELGADRIEIHGAFNVDGAVIDGIWDGGGEVGFDSRYWIVVNSDADQIGAGLFANMSFDSTHELANAYLNDLYADGFITLGGMEFAMFYSADFETRATTGGNDLLLSAMGSVVPEPSMATLFGAGLAALVMRRRRRH